MEQDYLELLNVQESTKMDTGKIGKNNLSKWVVVQIFVCVTKSILEWLQTYLHHVKLVFAASSGFGWFISVNLIWSNCIYNNSNILHVVNMLEFKDQLDLKKLYIDV